MKIQNVQPGLLRISSILSASLFLMACGSEQESSINADDVRGVLSGQQQNAIEAANEVGDILQQAAEDTEEELNKRLNR
jgi:hypothetical protein